MTLVFWLAKETLPQEGTVCWGYGRKRKVSNPS